MDLDTATETVDELFEEMGRDGLYFAPGGGQGASCRIVLWRPRDQRRADGTRSGFTAVAERRLYILVRAAEVAEPRPDGRFTAGAGAWTIGEDHPVTHDVHGIAWRCAVSA